ncbi:MAG TPA: hypothetical protein VLF59_03960 [Candidatus Saccharimonadales bacterium]|nr:hypothetical protein [Candidatus Saccharimonadales bacterium]
MKRLNQSGSHIIALALVVLALGVVGFAGYKVMQRNQKSPVVTANGTNIAIPTTIKTKTDLTVTAKSLDSASAELNSSIDTGSLDSSMNDLL